MRHPVALLIWCTLGVVLGACASRPPAHTTPAPPPEQPDEGVQGPWRISDPELPRAQEIRLLSELVSQIDTVTRRDSLESRLLVEWTPVGHPTGTAMTGTVSAFGVRASGADTFRTPVGLRIPFAFDATWQPGGMPTITGDSTGLCPTPLTSVLDGWRDLVVAVPPRFSVGDRWRDSTRYTMCRDGIPLEVSVVRSYRILGRADAIAPPAVRIERVAQRQIRGSGTQFGEPITIAGAGESTVELTMTLRGGIIVTGTGTSTLRLQLDGRHRRQALVQTSRLDVVIPNP